MPRTVPFLLLVVGISVQTGRAADPDSNVFRFSPVVKDGPFDEADRPDGWINIPPLRPNGSAVYHLYVQNPTEAEGSFRVELDLGTKLTAAVEKLPRMKWVRVTNFTKPAAVAPAPVPAPVVATAAPATAPAVEPPPPGTELARTADGFPVNLRLFKTDNTPFDQGKQYGPGSFVKLVSPKDYLTAESKQVAVTMNQAQVSLQFQHTEPKDAALPSVLKLSFPKPIGATGPITRDGVYQRTLAQEPKAGELKDAKPLEKPNAVLKGSATDFSGTFRADVAVDGVERAFIFVGTQNTQSQWQLSESEDVAIRVIPVEKAVRELATKPVAALPVRVEVDNPPKGSKVELRYHRSGDTAPSEQEIIRLGGARHEQVWLDATGDGLTFTTRSKDWVKPLNLSDTVGKVIVEAVLKYTDGTGGERSVTSGLIVSVDATPPDASPLSFDNLKNGKQLEKGKPLVLSATGTDLDSKVVKAVFFVGKPLEDGKLPPDAIKAEGTRKSPAKGKTESDVWTAALTLPADKRGELLVGVVFTDEAGNSNTPEPKRIELVDAPPPAAKLGSLEATVMFGERPQPGLTVVLADGEGKQKATAKTDDKGKAVFEKLLPGGYKLSVGKTDTTAGMAGAADATVEAEKKAKVTVELKKKR